MKHIIFILALCLVGCEVHRYPSGHTVTKFPTGTTTVDVVYAGPQEVVVVDDGPIMVDYSYPLYEDYCYDTPYDSCCYYYDSGPAPYPWTYWVCEVQECYDYYWYAWVFVSDDCWYE